MKNYILSLMALVCFSISIVSCGNKSKTGSEGTKSEVVDKTGKEYVSAYICPMHCKGSGSDKNGVCPVCGMDYVKNKNYKGTAHDHDGHDHEGHDHGDHDGHNHDGHDHGDHEGHNH
ncbi:MAG: heavy metal-binding domain-containing protein [Saprospiraceae bacterium]|nr:heavy metal-binding domain-containing protein [Saprospiraceae bacterium]